MAASSYRVATVDELQDIAYREDTHMRPVRHHLGITAFGSNAWTAAEVGDRLMPEHEEDPGNEELYVVLRGRARFEIDGDAVEAGTTVLAIGSTVGKPYEAGGWEFWAPFHPRYVAGDYEGVIADAREPL